MNKFRRHQVKKVKGMQYSGAFGLAVCLLLLSLPQAVLSQTPQSLHLQVLVNTDKDGLIQSEDFLTLREAIAIVNGTLPLEKLSDRQRSQVKTLNPDAPSHIEFELPPQATIINLNEVLPPLTSPGLVIDGTTQPGYLDTPIVAITPAFGKEVFRGLTVAADGVTIRGLSLYGFTKRHGATASTPPADIFIASLETEQQTREQISSLPPKDIVIENNWLGIPPSPTLPLPYHSAFGVSVFNSLGTTIQHNRIANHDGSAIITSVRAENLRVQENVIESNGFAGMPDAIRLEGAIANSQISANQIRNNAGSAIYLFKPEGSVKISHNIITHNGQKLLRAAIYLMGNGHQVVDNQIADQSGSGVVVTAYPESIGNRIQNNQFSHLAGLSIDLVTQQGVGVQDYQQGDGVNPIADSDQRHRKTGNFGIDAPHFLSPEFFLNPEKGTVTLDGVATPGSVVEIYRVTEDGSTNGPLNEEISTINVDRDGRFSSILGNLKAGEHVSAIATHPQYGTSEPAVNAVVRSIAEVNNH